MGERCLLLFHFIMYFQWLYVHGGFLLYLRIALSDHICDKIKELNTTLVCMKVMLTLFLSFHGITFGKSLLYGYLLPWKRNERYQQKSCNSHKAQQCRAYEIQIIETSLALLWWLNPSNNQREIFCCCYKWFLTLDLIADLYLWSYICSQILCFICWYTKISF